MSMVETTDIERRVAERIDPRVTGALEISRQSGGLAFTNANEAMEFAKMMAVSQIGVRKHLRGNVGACLAIVVQSIEWRMSPFAVANKSYLVNDQIAYESQLVQAVILKRAPIKGRFKVEYLGDGGKRRCRVSAALSDTGETVDYTSPEFDKITPKNSPLWKSDPDQQQFYYAGRALCRRHFPDVLLGVYDVDELDDDPRPPEPPRDVTPRTLSGRLDALAAPATPAHDAETGEIIEGTQTGAPEVHPAAPQAAAATAGNDLPPSETAAVDQSETAADRLLFEARREAINGRKAFDRWYRAIEDHERDMLNGHIRVLLAAAAAADGVDAPDDGADDLPERSSAGSPRVQKERL